MTKNILVRTRIIKTLIITFLIALAMVIPKTVYANGSSEDTSTETLVTPYNLTINLIGEVDTAIATLPNVFFENQNQYGYTLILPTEEGQALNVIGDYTESSDTLYQNYSIDYTSTSIELIFNNLYIDTTINYKDLFIFDYNVNCRYYYECNIYDFEDNAFYDESYVYNSTTARNYRLFSCFQTISATEKGIWLGPTLLYNDIAVISQLKVTISELEEGDSFDNFTTYQKIMNQQSYNELLRQSYFDIKNNYQIGDFGEQLLNGATNFLKFEIVEGFSLLDLLFTIVAIPLLIFILKLFLGG